MLIRNMHTYDVKSSEITPKSAYFSRRRLLKSLAGGSAVVAFGPYALNNNTSAATKIPNLKQTKWTLKSLGESVKLTSYDDITSYNNFYEFGTSKGDPKRNARLLKTRPWTIIVDGHTENPGRYAFEDLVKFDQLEERVYRFRCVEAWSMVVPWVGIPLANIIRKLGPTSNAKYIAFETLADSKQMPGIRSRVLNWPYVEGLRLDEAMNPLTLMAIGLYGEILPNQNGAPIRLVVPWKYGFKSIKSIVRITFSEEQPPTSWNLSAPREYGFYSNVNPEVDHPRWSQAKERLLGGPTNMLGFVTKQPTLMFNGYTEEVEGLYQGMDLNRHF